MAQRRKRRCIACCRQHPSGMDIIVTVAVWTVQIAVACVARVRRGHIHYVAFCRGLSSRRNVCRFWVRNAVGSAFCKTDTGTLQDDFCKRTRRLDCK